MTPMDEFAREKAERIQDTYRSGVMGHELQEGRWNLYIDSFDAYTDKANYLIFKIGIKLSDKDDDGIERWSDVVFRIDPEMPFLIEKWAAFCRPLGLQPESIDLTKVDDTFADLFNQEFRGDVSIREYNGRFYVDVHPISMTGNVVGKPPF
jgi:hypothetical protein